jgi:hypothetical protein
MKQLLEGLCGDVQAAVLADCPAYSLSAFTNVNNHDLQSLPPSQDYDKPSDTALLRSSFPVLLQNFTEAEAVALMLLGLRDSDAVNCVKHGVKKDSAAAAAQLNPLDAVFRMAADMSGCFTSPRSLVVAPLPALQLHPLFTSSAPAPADASTASGAADVAQAIGALKDELTELKHGVELINRKEDLIISGQEHDRIVQAELHSKPIPRLLLLLPHQVPGADMLGKLHNWMESRVFDRLQVVMQCEMRVATNKLRSCDHGVLWHRPKPANPSDQPYGYTYLQPKSSIKKLKTLMRYITIISKVCSCALYAFNHAP